MKPQDQDTRIDEARWQAQERAFQSARRGDADADADELRIARALRSAPPVALPAYSLIHCFAPAKASPVAPGPPVPETSAPLV